VSASDQPPSDLLAAIEGCNQQCEKILEQFTGELVQGGTPDHLYHYTDGPGLWGILESRSFRLTDIFGLNDPSELRHGIEHAGQILAAEARRGHPAAKVFAEIFRRGLREGVTQLAQMYVACFSQDGDELGQWRAYADNGRGFALEFDGSQLEQAFVATAPASASYSTFPVLYDTVRLRGLGRQLAQRVIPLTARPQGRPMSSIAINEFMKQLTIHASFHVVHTALYFKHKAYAEEQEYRFLQMHAAGNEAPDVRLRARGSALVRYTPFRWAREQASALTGIVIGPAADGRRARTFVRECLKHAELDVSRIRIRRSQIPYRG
jgi:hypothetical protein